MQRSPSDSSFPHGFLKLFTPADADELLGWVRSDEELRRLAPGTPPPLTAEKILRWQKPRGTAYFLQREASAALIGYAELNPMRDEPEHFWLGHVLIKPGERGKGWGRALVAEVVRRAFAEQDAQRVSLIVFPDNEPALRCYQSLGFKERGAEFHHFHATGQTHRMLRLELPR